MKTARNIILGIFGLGAWTLIDISGTMLRDYGGVLSTDNVVYVVLLVLSVIYFHWLSRVFVMPLSGLSHSERFALIEQAMSKYWGGFFRGSVGFGYFLLILYIFAYVVETPRHSEVPNFALGAIFFIGLGVLAQARGLVLVLTRREFGTRQKDGIEPDGAANGSQPIRSERNSTSSAAGSRR